MPTPPHIAHQPHQRAAIIRLILPRPDLPAHLPFAFAELLLTLADQRLSPTGPFFAHYLRITPTVVDLELGLPIPSPIRAFGRVDPGQIPACTVARTLHHGPWFNLPTAWQEFDLWLTTEPRHTPANDLWELFHTTPETTPNPAHHRTELLRGLRPGIRPTSATNSNARRTASFHRSEPQPAFFAFLCAFPAYFAFAFALPSVAPAAPFAAPRCVRFCRCLFSLHSRHVK